MKKMVDKYQNQYIFKEGEIFFREERILLLERMKYTATFLSDGQLHKIMDFVDKVLQLEFDRMDMLNNNDLKWQRGEDLRKHFNNMCKLLDEINEILNKLKEKLDEIKKNILK